MRHIISILLENEAGALSRVSGLFSARAYNIDSVPTLIVDGKYMTNANIAGGYDKVPKVLDFLVKKAAAERTAPKK